MPTKVEFVVRLPKEVTDELNQHSIAAYIREAVQNWSGQFHPDSPSFSAFDKATVTIRSTKDGKT